MDMLFQYPRDVAAALHEALLRRRSETVEKLALNESELAQVGAQFDYLEPIPSIKSLQSLLDVAFFASLTKEEGAPVSFSLLYCDSALASQSKWPAVQFADHLPLAVEQLRKLSPAASPKTTDIGVYECDQGLSIWGLVYARRTGPTVRTYPLGLAIRTHQPGVLTATCMSELLLTYANGLASFPAGQNAVDQKSLLSLIAKAFDQDQTFPERMISASCILRLALAALEAGSGATLLIVPSGLNTTDLKFRYPLDATTNPNLVDIMSATDGSTVTAAVSGLVNLDGALVLDERGKILGAGAMIQVPETPDFKVMIVSPNAPSSPPSSFPLSQFSGGRAIVQRSCSVIAIPAR